MAKNVVSGGFLAIKVEARTPHIDENSTLEREYTIYQLLHGLTGEPADATNHGSITITPVERPFGVPAIYGFEKNEFRRLMMMQLLGYSVQDLFDQRYPDGMPPLAISKIAIDTLQTLKLSIHASGIIHSDIKPDNSMFGNTEHEPLGGPGCSNPRSDQVYLVDYGLARRFINSQKKRHVRLQQRDRDVEGTTRYASLNSHMGLTLSRRDDLWSLGYMLVYLHTGTLPWCGIQQRVKEEQDQRFAAAAAERRRRKRSTSSLAPQSAEDQQREADLHKQQTLLLGIARVAQCKAETSLETLCRDCKAPEFLLYFQSVQELRFDEVPNYKYLVDLFRSMSKRFAKSSKLDPDWYRLPETPTANPSQEAAQEEDEEEQDGEESVQEERSNQTV